jgi:hypothetical protein
MAASSIAIRNYASAVPSPLPFPSKVQGPEVVAPERDLVRLQRQFDSILKGIKKPAVEEAVQIIFTGLSRLRDILRIVELNVSDSGPLSVTMASFALIECESKSLIRFVDARISSTKSIKGPLKEALDSTNFAIRHELKRVFGHDLARLSADQTPEEVRVDVMRSHGLLSNCFQQSILTLARVFNPSVDGELLFDDYRARLKQSAMLLSDLSSLAQQARRFQDKRNTETSAELIRDIKTFCNGSMHYLMYRDWDEFEDVAGEVVSSHGSARHTFILHCFATYLEALINQVRMRTVLNDQTPVRMKLKPVKKTRRGRR